MFSSWMFQQHFQHLNFYCKEIPPKNPKMNTTINIIRAHTISSRSLSLAEFVCDCWYLQTILHCSNDRITAIRRIIRYCHCFFHSLFLAKYENHIHVWMCASASNISSCSIALLVFFHTKLLSVFSLLFSFFLRQNFSFQNCSEWIE